MNEHNRVSGGLGLCSTLTVLFIVLKLVGVIEWSWLLVLAPFWIPMAILALALLLATKYM